MNKKLKIALAAFVVIASLLGLGVWYAISSVNPAQLTQLLSSSIREATGRDLKITGPVRLSVFPSIGVYAEDVSLSNATWASEADMVLLKRIEIGIRLLPLLHKRVEISRIDLSGLDAHLQSNITGQSNWVLAAPLAQGATKTTSSGDSDSFISIENVSVTDAHISYQEGSGPQKIFDVKRLSFSGDGDKTVIHLEMKHANAVLGIKGTITSLRKILSDWGVTPLKVGVDLTIDLNGKPLLVQGQIEKVPQKLPGFDINLSSKSFDLTALLAGYALAASGGNLPKITQKPNQQSKYFFNEDRLPFDLLPEANGKLSLDIAQLGLPYQLPIQNLKTTLIFVGDRIDVQGINFDLGGGHAQGAASLSQLHSSTPVLAMNGFASGFTLEQLMLDAKSKVSGGDTRIAFELKISGSSLHQLASKANGKFQISVGKATLASTFLNQGGDFVIMVLDTVNPQRKKATTTSLECAVAYLPINNGLISVTDSVGIETDRLDVLLNGSINLNNELINLNIYPREKSGITLGVDLANLIKLQGTLQNPSVGIDKAAVVKSAVSIGLGFLTGGASILAENAKSMTTKSQPCKAALHPWSDIYAGAN
jgi:uncharacterized protein involved in outer membrane biogenesis